MIKEALLRYKWYALGSILLVTTVVVTTLLQPSYLKEVLTAVLMNDQAEIFRVGKWLLVIAGVGLLAGMCNTIVAAKIAQGVSADVREQTFRKIQSFSYANIEEFNAGNLVVRMTNDVTQIQNLIMMSFTVLLRVPLLFIGAFFMAVRTLPELWWMIIVMVVVIASIMAIVMKHMGPRFGKFQVFMDKMNGIAKENLRGIRVVKSFVQEREQYAKFKETSNDLLDLNLFIGYGFSILQPVMMFVSFMAIFTSLYLVSGMVEDNLEVVGGFTSFMSYLMQIMFSIIMTSFMGMNAARAAISIKRINEILETEPAMTFVDTPDEDLAGNIVFDNVSFTYPHDTEPTLKNISFEIESGQMVGVVGATGAGKSTLAQLIPRLFDPQEGTVSIGGRDLKAVNQKTLRQTVSIARGVIGNPKVLVLDDSTSALDAKSEKLVQEALNHDLKGTTTVIIAQKISSVVKADKILVLDEGRLIDEGTHAELVANNAVYREIYETQKGKEED